MMPRLNWSGRITVLPGAARRPNLTVNSGIAWARQLPSADVKIPFTGSQDVAAGKRLFEVRCAPCHGLFGEGGRGPTLAHARLVRTPDDASLYKVIRGGIPQTEMPGAAGMDETQIREVAAYVRTLGTHGVETVPGDPAAGERLYRTKGGCGVCHMVGTEGGVIGPPLGEVGARRSAAYLRAVLLDPASKLPEDFLQISVVTRDGQRLVGIRMNEDTYSIRMRDLSGYFHSFWKSDLSELNRSAKSTPMPSYRNVFSPSQLTDVVAYLSSLQGEK
jgi:cytochrome c oxidase cbb3-type subunit III